MASKMKSSFYWALTALQIAPDNSCDSSILKTSNHHDLRKSEILEKHFSHEVENVKPAYSRDSVSDHCTPDSCWIIVNNKVYDVTRFLRMHPGGEDIILEHGGCDASSAFIDKGHSRDGYDMLAEYLIGEIIPEERWPEKKINVT